MTSLLPNQIVPEGVPFIEKNGRNNHTWWLFFYNLSLQVLGNSTNTTIVEQVQSSGDVDADIDATNELGLVQRVTNLEKSQSVLADPVVQVWAPPELLPDPIARAQPVQTLTVGASPFAYQAPFDGWVITSGGTITAQTLTRDGTHFYAVSGVVPMSRLDTLTLTYTAAPTAVFFPR